MVSLEYALFIFVLQLPRCRSRDTFRKFLDKRVHASTNIMQPNLSFQPLPYCNSSHELHWGQWQTYIWTRPVATVHHSKTVYAWDLVTMQAITFYSTKRLSWQLFDLILRTWNSSCDKTETPGTSVISLYQPGVWNATPSAWHYKVSLFWYLKNTKSNFTDKIKNAVSQSHIHVYMFFQS